MNIHQSKSGDHDRLGFHPDCPLCRQDRLFGVLASDPAFARRVRVLLATGVLAFSAGATATSVASEPDQQQEGALVPEQGAPPADQSGGGAEPPSEDVGSGSGGETALPFEIDPAPADPREGPPADGSDDSAPLEAQPVDDPDGRLPLTNPDSPDDGNAEDAPSPPAEAAPPAPPAAPAPPLDVPSELTGETGSSEEAPAAKPERKRRVTNRRRENRGHSKRNAHDKTPSAESLPAVETPTDSPAVDVSAQYATVAAVSTATASLEGRRFHVVRPGESLWSIASELLGPGASARAIALEVRRLWRLNRERIGTGDPNLLIAGVRLRLR